LPPPVLHSPPREKMAGQVWLLVRGPQNWGAPPKARAPQTVRLAAPAVNG